MHYDELQRLRVRVPFQAQVEARDCGAAALGMILAYYGQRVPLHELRTACAVGREGSRVINILQAARRYGLQTSALKRERLDDIPLPSIIFWNFNHFLVVEAVNSQTIVVQDPAYGRRIISNELVHRCFTGIVLTFEISSSFAPTQTAVPPIPTALFSPASVIFTVVAILRVLPEIALVAAISGMITGQPVDWQHIGIMWGLFGFLQLVTWLNLQRIYSARNIFAHLLGLSPAFFLRHYTQEITARVLHNDAAVLHHTVLDQFAGLVRAVVFLIVLIHMNFRLVLVLAPVIVMGLSMIWAAGSERSYDAQYDYWRQRFQAVVTNSLTNIEMLKLSGREQQALIALEQAAAEAFSETFPGWRAYRSAIAFLTPALLLLACAWLVDTNLILLNEAILAFCAAMLITHHLDYARTLPTTIHPLRIALAKQDDIWHENPAAIEYSSEDPALLNVSFGYTNTATVTEITLRVPPGQQLGIVGRSGSGKSTIVALIAGHISPWTGQVCVSQSRALADGHPALLSGTLLDNVRLFDPRVSVAEVVNVLEEVCLDELVPYLNDPITTDGIVLTQSQRQRLDIARALVRNPAVILLDEATSALDVLTEARLLDNLTRRGCRCVIVSHRLSAVRDCDEIIVLEAGHIVQRGTHAALVATSGMYTTLLSEGVLI